MAEFGKLNFSVSFNPTSAFPLDARCYFETLTAALGSYSGRSTAAGSITTHSLNNSTGYKYLRISITSPAASSGDWTGFGDIRIEGEVVDA